VVTQGWCAIQHFGLVYDPGVLEWIVASLKAIVDEGCDWSREPNGATEHEWVETEVLSVSIWLIARVGVPLDTLFDCRHINGPLMDE
jgi:hypothetical protein